MSMAYNVLDIANKILAKPNSEYEELISNMKLQKLLYYMQGFHLAYFGTPLFDARIEAWQYGPVVPSAYDHFSKYKSQGIKPESEDIITLSEKEERLFDEVYKVYGEYSAIGLMNMTHNESPWSSTNTGKGNVISREKMKNFFKGRIE